MHYAHIRSYTKSHSVPFAHYIRRDKGLLVRKIIISRFFPSWRRACFWMVHVYRFFVWETIAEGITIRFVEIVFIREQTGAFGGPLRDKEKKSQKAVLALAETVDSHAGLWIRTSDVRLQLRGRGETDGRWLGHSRFRFYIQGVVERELAAQDKLEKPRNLDIDRRRYRYQRWRGFLVVTVFRVTEIIF